MPLAATDPTGFIITETIDKVPLSVIQRRNPGRWATTLTEKKSIGNDWIVEYKDGCCFCAWVKQAVDILLEVKTLIPNDNVGTLWTNNGLAIIEAHEGRRREAIKNGYYAYIEPAFGSGALTKKCNVLCSNSPGEAASALSSYLTELRRRAIEDYNSYVGYHQFGINLENYFYEYDSFGLMDGLGFTWHVTKPWRGKTTPCPRVNCDRESLIDIEIPL